MPYNKRYFKKRVGQIYANRYQITREAANYAKMAKNIAYLMSVVNVEYKNNISSLSLTPDTTGTVNNLCMIAEGSDNTERNGRSVRLKSLQIKGTCYSNSTAPNSVRILLVKTKQNQTTAPDITDVIRDVSVNSLRVTQTHQRTFTVLMDRKIVLSGDGGLAGKSVNVFKKLDHHLYFSGALATEASSGQGAIYLMAIGDRASTNLPALELECEVRFVDN